jgi:septum formation protein
MKSNYILLLASSSKSRQLLLKESKIPFQLVAQDADESQYDRQFSLQQVVEHIARFKMDHAILPKGQKEGDLCFVLTADTLSQDLNGVIHGKPADRADAIAKIKAARNGAKLCTAFCLDKKVWRNNAWHIATRIERAVFAEYTFIISDEWIDNYLNNVAFHGCSNAIAVEGYGWQFLKEVHGSYTSIMGLPVYEVREALEEIGFFN